MDIDLKKEQEKAQEVIQQLVNQGNQLSDNINLLQQQRQEIVNKIVGEKRLLGYLQEKEKKEEK